MAKMLDLTTLQEQTMQIKMLDGTELRLKKPSQNLMLKLVALEKRINEENVEKQMDSIKEITIAILNNNTSGKTFDDLDQNYDLSIQQAIVTAYGEFINEVMAQKN